MNFLNQIPFLRILFPFATGIAIWLIGKQDAPQIIFLAAIYGICVAFYLLLVKKAKNSVKFIFGLALQIFLFVGGWELCQYNNEKENPWHHTQLLSQEPEYYAGYVSEIPVEKSKSIKAEIVLQYAKQNGEWKSTSGKIIVYFEKSENSKNIETGQTIVFSGQLKELQGPLNPHEFDYKNYLSLKNIFYTSYLKENNWKIADKVETFSFFASTQKIRKYLLDTYRSSGLQESEFALVAALVLGYDDEIDRPLMNAYSHTGTLHVLSVSGLHVGIIYILLGYMLGFLNKHKKLIWLKVFLILTALWFFILLSGFSAPAVRAGLMFSLILIGKTLFEHVETANIVFVSAFISLCYNPFWLSDAGFQLSYVAVLGIIYLYPYFYNMFSFSWSFAEKIWKLCAVSMAAQLATLPITLYYFHQFPVLFLITNLVLIPVSIVVMYGGILVLVFSKVSFIAKALVGLTAILIKFMNGSALFFDQLPFCVIDNINLSILNMLLIYVLIVFVFLAIEYRSYKLVLSSLALVIFMFCVSLFFDFKTKSTNELVIYHSDKSNVFGFFDKNSYTEISDTIDERLSSAVRENKIYHDIISKREVKLGETSLVMVGNKKILFSKNNTISPKLIEAVQPDYVWVPATTFKNKKKSSTLFETTNLIVSGTIWNKKALERLNNAYLTSIKGAFILH